MTSNFVTGQMENSAWYPQCIHLIKKTTALWRSLKSLCIFPEAIPLSSFNVNTYKTTSVFSTAASYLLLQIEHGELSRFTAEDAAVVPLCSRSGSAAVSVLVPVADVSREDTQELELHLLQHTLRKTLQKIKRYAPTSPTFNIIKVEQVWQSEKGI